MHLIRAKMNVFPKFVFLIFLKNIENVFVKYQQAAFHKKLQIGLIFIGNNASYFF